jgi:hypothetical protein
MSNIEKDECVKISLIIRRQRLAAFDKWLPITGLTDRDELFNEALALYAWTVDERSKEHFLASINPETGAYQELPMMPLDQRVEPGTVLTRPDDYELVHDDPMVRVRIEIPGAVMEAFDTNRRFYGFTSHDDLLNRAQDTFLLAMKACNNSHRFGTIGDGHIYWPPLPFLDQAHRWLNQN